MGIAKIGGIRMYSNSKISKAILDKLNESIEQLGETENIVPSSLKRTFNFKGRKSVDVATKLIETLTSDKDIVCDPFVGSGSFAFACSKAGRAFIGCELDNYTYDALKILFEKYNRSLFDELFSQVKRDCYEPIMELYATKCCGVKNYIDKLHFDPETNEYYNPTAHRDIKDNRTIIMLESCPVCGDKTKLFEQIDEAKIMESNKLNTSKFPKHKLIENSRINITTSTGADKYDRNFTNRAKFALLLIQDSINNLPESFERDMLEHCLVASLALSRISQYGSGTEYLYQVMRRQSQEKNVWEVFQDKAKNFVKLKHEFDFAQVEDLIANNSKVQIYRTDYKTFLEKPKFANFFNLIYSDPPYTDQVAYLERSQMFRDWINCFYNKDDFKLTSDMLEREMVVTNAPSRPNKQGYEQYYSDIDKMFFSFYNCLKKDGIVVFTIKLPGNKYFITLAEFITLARKNGFEFALKFGIDKKDPTLRKQAAFNKTISKEMIVFFVKLDEEKRYWYVNGINYDFEIVKLLYNKIKKSRDLAILLPECIKHIENDLLKNHKIISNEKMTENIKSIIHSEFYVAPNALVSIDPNNLYLEMEDSSDIFTKLFDTIPIIIKKLLKDNDGFTLDDMYFEMLNVVCNGNPNVLNQVLNDKTHERQIQALVENYCDLVGKKYVLKKLKNYVNEDSQDISTMDGYEFEELVSKLLEKEGYFNIAKVGKAGDRGVDIYAKKTIDGNEEGFIFQCKRWIGNVSGTPIQRLHSMVTQMSPEFSQAICVTTSNYTSHALDEAKKTGVETINGVQLLERLNSAFPNQYYHGALNFTHDSE